MNTEYLAKGVLKTAAPDRRIKMQKCAALVLSAQKAILLITVTSTALLLFGIIAILGFTFLSRGQW